MTRPLYDYRNYRAYLRDVLEPRGRKKELSESIPCQTTFLSNVLAGSAHLSLEHAIRTSEHLGHSARESHYFMLLVHHGKAGSKDLEAYYEKQLATFRLEQEKIASHIADHKTMRPEDQLKLYNSWLSVAVHILAAIPALRTRAALAEYLKLPPKELNPTIDFLVQCGLLIELQGVLSQGETRVHLPKGSPFLQKHHMNWRMKALHSLDHEREHDLHYSMVLSLSKKDVARVKEMIFETVSNTDRLLAETESEVVYSFCMDWFKV